MSQLPARILHDLDLEVATLAQDCARVDHSWVARSRSLGAGVEAQWARLPDAVRAQLEAQVAQALRVGLGIAKAAPQTSPRQQRWMVIASGAAGGAVGLAGALADLPVALCLMNTDGTNRRRLVEFIGGQGSINVPCWSPDGGEFAFVSYG